MKEKYKVVLSIILILFVTVNTVYFLISQKKDDDILKILDENFYLNGQDTIILEYGNDYKEEGFTVTLEENKSPNNIRIKNNVDIDNIGDYIVSYTLNYKNKTKTLLRKIKIIDTIAPTIKIDCDKDLYVNKNGKLKECKYEVTDNYDKMSQSNVSIKSNVDLSKIGTYTIKYTAKDSSGNTTTETINVHVRNKFDVTYIKINLTKQRLYYYQNNKIVLTTPITSGRNNYTKTGKFKVWNKVRNAELKGKDYVSHVQYWMAYNGNSFGIHDASWRRRFGTMDYKWNGSHGCINVPTNAMKKLYNMVEVGTPVYITN